MFAASTRQFACRKQAPCIRACIQLWKIAALLHDGLKALETSTRRILSLLEPQSKG